MNYQEAWKTVLEQLQTQMPRASFDTWVRDTKPLSLENGVLTIVVRNSYARDWLESRISSTARHVLIGILNMNVEVSFVVGYTEANSETADDSEGDDSPENSSGGLIVEPVDATRYQDEVHPDRIVMLDGYALRMLEHGDLSPREMSLWVGFRQAIYQRWKNGIGSVKNIPYWEVLRFAMMSRATYFRETTGKESFAGGLIEEVPSVPGVSTDRRFDNARRYRVQMSPRLTRRDCAAIEAILVADICMAATKSEAREVALATLRRLAEADPGEYLRQPIVVVGNAWPKSVEAIVRNVLEIKGDMPAELHEASERVLDRILRGFGKVFITHYFLQTVVRRLDLTLPQAWAIIALRDRSWYDHETRTQKDFAVLSGGLDELSSWVGVDRKSVKRWLANPAFAMFVTMEDMSAVELPETWDARTTIFAVRQDEPLEEEMLDKMSNDTGQSEQRPGTKRATMPDKMSNDTGQNEQRLNNLIKPLLNPNKPQETLPVKGGWAGSRSFWDFDFLMDNNQVSPENRKRLLKTNKSKWGRDIASLSAGFVSWVLYAYSSEGMGVKNPVGLAIKRLNENLHAGAHGSFDKLAKLTPFALRALFDADFAGVSTGESLEAHIYSAVFSELQKSHKLELYGRLFGFGKDG